MEIPTHTQTIDTRPFFPSSARPGNEAKYVPAKSDKSILHVHVYSVIYRLQPAGSNTTGFVTEHYYTKVEAGPQFIMHSITWMAMCRLHKLTDGSFASVHVSSANKTIVPCSVCLS